MSLSSQRGLARRAGWRRDKCSPLHTPGKQENEHHICTDTIDSIGVVSLQPFTAACRICLSVINCDLQPLSIPIVTHSLLAPEQAGACLPQKSDAEVSGKVKLPVVADRTVFRPGRDACFEQGPQRMQVVLANVICWPFWHSQLVMPLQRLQRLQAQCSCGFQRNQPCLSSQVSLQLHALQCHQLAEDL